MVGDEKVQKHAFYLYVFNRGVTGYLKLGGQEVMRRAAATRRRLLFCQKLGGPLSLRP